MRHIITAIAASLALAACGVEGDPAEVHEADASQLHFEAKKATLTTQRTVCDCTTAPCNASLACMGDDGERVATTAGGNPEGHETFMLILDHGDLFMQVTERGQFLVASDKGMENVMATLDGFGGEVKEVTAYESIDAYTEELGSVGVQITTGEGSVFVLDNLAAFTAKETGYY